MSDWQVFPALHEEAREGWIWASKVPNPTSPHVLVRNLTNGRRVVCEQRMIDTNFRRVYNQSPRTDLPNLGNVVVASAYYREKLGLSLETGVLARLDLYSIKWPLAGVRAGVSHPSSAVRTATWLGVLSALLGVLSLGLALAVLLR